MSKPGKRSPILNFGEGHRRVTIERRKLTMAQAAAIRRSSETLSALAMKYGVSKGAIQQIRQGITYRP